MGTLVGLLIAPVAVILVAFLWVQKHRDWLIRRSWPFLTVNAAFPLCMPVYILVVGAAAGWIGPCGGGPPGPAGILSLALPPSLLFAWASWSSMRAWPMVVAPITAAAAVSGLRLFPVFDDNFALTLPLIWTTIVVAALLAWAIPAKPLSAHQCPACRYDLRGLPREDPCPECGRPSRLESRDNAPA